jgi:uncharacterized protein Smg (DUF494 family)
LNSSHLLIAGYFPNKVEINQRVYKKKKKENLPSHSLISFIIQIDIIKANTIEKKVEKIQEICRVNILLHIGGQLKGISK